MTLPDNLFLVVHSVSRLCSFLLSLVPEIIIIHEHEDKFGHEHDYYLILATDREYVLPPPELLGSDRVPLLGPLHVLVHLGDGHQEVPLVAQDGPRQQHNKTTNCCVLKI